MYKGYQKPIRRKQLTSEQRSSNNISAGSSSAWSWTASALAFRLLRLRLRLPKLCFSYPFIIISIKALSVMQKNISSFFQRQPPPNIESSSSTSKPLKIVLDT
uniref:Uncharacterized protein n=1 Tax=Helianthus annuus TaxID=4232 RepID=A0A251USC5_HELAN